MYEEAIPGPTDILPGLAILAPINNSTVAKSFSVDGSYAVNGATISINVTDNGNASVAMGSALVVNMAWNVAIAVAAPGVNPHGVTATVVGVAGSEIVFVNIDGLIASDSGDGKSSSGDD